MKRPQALDNIAIVLVEPLYSGNIGSVCRAMKNMWVDDLRLVHPPLDRNKDAYNMATCARDLLADAKKYFTLEEALEDCQYVVGTTARLGGWRKSTESPRNAAKEILKVAGENKVAILFGSEDRGLSNEHIRFCNSLVTIPTNPDASSLNIAMAVMVMCYELFTAPYDNSDKHLPKLAEANQVAAMFDEMNDALDKIGFMRPGATDYWMMPIRRLLGRTGLQQNEVQIMRGIFRQMRWIHSKAQPQIEADKTLEEKGKKGKPDAE